MALAFLKKMLGGLRGEEGDGESSGKADQYAVGEGDHGGSFGFRVDFLRVESFVDGISVPGVMHNGVSGPVTTSEGVSGSTR